MAIKGYNSGVIDSGSVPIIDKDTRALKDGDMLYFDSDKNVFVGRDGIQLPTKLSELANDREFVTEYQLNAAVANALSGGEVDLDDYAQRSYVDLLIAGVQSQISDIGDVGTGFSGDYNDLTNTPTIPDITGLASVDYVNTRAFSGDYNDLVNKPAEQYQTLSISGNTLSISEGNAVDLDTVLQDLSLSGTVLSISEGNHIDLGTLVDDFVTEDSLDNRLGLLNVSHGYAKEAFVLEQITNALTDGEVDLTGYVTNVELNQRLASIDVDVDLTNYYTKSETDALVPDLTPYALSSAIPNVDEFVTEAEVDNKISTATADNATQTWVTDQLSSYQPTVDLTSYYTKSEVNALVTPHFSGDYNDLINAPTVPDTTNFLTETEIDSKIASAVANVAVDLTGYATEAYVQQEIANVNSGGAIDLSDYVTESELATELANYQPTVDLTSYYTKTQVDALVTPHFSGDYNDLINAPDISVFVQQSTLSNYYTKTQIDALIPDTSNFLTEAQIDAKIVDAGTIDLTDYYTKIQVDALLPTYNISDYYTKTQTDAIIPDLTSYYTKAQVDTLLANTGNGGGGNVDLTGYATETYVNQQISNASIGGIANLDDLNDVATGSLPQVNNANEYYLLEYNPVNALWESRDFGSIFATQQYVTETVATIVTDGDINLDGYATEQFVEQKLLERGDHFSGSYFDLVNRPILFSGDYNDLLNKPAGNSDLRMQLVGQELQLINIEPEPDTVISTVDLSDLGNAISANISYDNLANLPNLFSGDYGDLVNRPQLFSGNYHDLANKPYIPSIAGLASEEYVDNRWAEPTITGDRYYTDNVEVTEKLTVKQSSLASHTATKTMIALALQTTDATPTEVVYPDGSPVLFAANSTVMLTATIVAAGVNVNSNSAIIHKGIVSVDSTSATLVGEAAQEIVSESQYNWSSNIYTLENGSRELKIQVAGSATETVNWTVFLEAHEIINT